MSQDTDHPEAANENGETPPTGQVVGLPGIPLLITKAQRTALRDRGFNDEEIRRMTPAEAHKLLT